MCEPTYADTCVKTWVARHVLENYICLLFGKDLHNAEFGYSYDYETIHVGDCESLCDIEKPLFVFKILLQPLFERLF